MKKSVVWTVFIMSLFSLLGAARPKVASLFADITYEDVLKAVQQNHPRNVAEVLPLLNKDFMSSYTLVYDSNSLQSATPENPRAIVFGRTGKFILTFNGESSEKNFDTLEMMQFRDETKTFELHQISFVDGEPVISEKNPQVCMACHGTEPHPIWQNYFSWPGVYGSFDDTISPGDEQTWFAAFNNGKAVHPQYKNLQVRSDLSPAWPFRKGDVHHALRPNNRLGRLLGGLAAQRGSQAVLSSEFYKSHPNSVLYHLIRCDDESKAAYFQKIDTLFQTRYPQAEFRALYINLETIKTAHDKATLELEKLILNTDEQTWDLAVYFQANGGRFSPDGYDPSTPAGRAGQQIEDMIGAWIFSGLAKNDSEIRPFYEQWTASQNVDGQNQDGYAKAYVEPYGISDAYDAVNLYLNRDLESKACPTLEKRVASEL